MEAVLARDLCHADFVRATGEEPVSKVLGQLLEANTNFALVFDENDSYLGVTSKEDFLRDSIDFSGVKVKSWVRNKPILFGDDPVWKIAELMFASGSRVLPVFEEKKFLGVVTVKDVLQNGLAPESLQLTVKTVASSAPVLVLESESVEKALSVMRSKKISRIPLVSKSGELSGLFSFRDFLEHLAFREHERPRSVPGIRTKAEKQKVLHSPVKDFSSSNPIIVKPGDSLESALAKMVKQNISSLVVVDQKKPVGILTNRDLLGLVAKPVLVPSNIQFSDLPPLDEMDLQLLKTRAQQLFDKLSKIFSKEIRLTVHCKSQRSGGAHKKHLVHVHLNGPGLNVSAHAEDWHFLKAAQEAFRALEKELMRKKP